MNNRAEYLALTRLKNNPDYQVLVTKWLYLISKIEDQRDKSASKASEGNWKYFAGQEKGAKIMMMALDLAIKDLEAQDANLVEESNYEKIVDEVIHGRKDK